MTSLIVIIKKTKLALQIFKSLTHMTDNPLEAFSDNQTNSINNPTGSTSPPPSYTNQTSQ